MTKHDDRPTVSNPEKFEWKEGDVVYHAPQVSGACPTCWSDPCTCPTDTPVELVSAEEQLKELNKVEEEPDLPEPVKAYEEYIPDMGDQNAD